MNSNCQYQLKFNERRAAQPRAMNNPGHHFQNVQHRREQIDGQVYKYARQNPAPQQWQNPIPHNYMQHLKNPSNRIQNTSMYVPVRIPIDIMKDTPIGTPTGTPMGTIESNFKLGNPQHYLRNLTGAKQVSENNELRIEEEDRSNYEMSSITRTPKHAPKDLLHDPSNYSAVKESRQKVNNDLLERVRQLQQKVEPLMRSKCDSIDQTNGFEGRLERKINRMETLVEKLKQNLEINMEKKLMEMEKKMEEKYREVRNILPIQRQLNSQVLRKS